MSSIQNFEQAVVNIFQTGSMREKSEAVSIFFEHADKLVDEIKEEGAEIGNIRSLTRQIKKGNKQPDSEEAVAELRERLEQAKKDKWSFSDKRKFLTSLTSQQKDLLRVIRRK